MTVMQKEDENSSIEAGSLKKCDSLIKLLRAHPGWRRSDPGQLLTA
jgi:hypothetical protein